MNIQHNRFTLRTIRSWMLVFLTLNTGCEGILGIEGFKIGCPEGCIGQTCIDGQCVGECAAGEKSCHEAKTPKSCDESGHWVFEATCEYACFEGICGCEPGQTRCDGNVLFSCGDLRTWMDEVCEGQTCAMNSDSAKYECRGECAPGKRCLGITPQTCNATGDWENLPSCAADEQCKAGECIESCTPKSKRCSDDKKQRQTCNENGQWQNDVNGICVKSTCDPDTVECVGVCAPGEKNCQNEKTLQSCGPDGQWQDEETCVDSCDGNACTACIPGEFGCKENSPQFCGMDGQWQIGAPCFEATCVAAVCQGECAPGKRCLGNTPQNCNAEGVWEGTTPCDAGQECKAGSCDCVPGDWRCFDNTPQTCNTSTQWEDVGPRCSGMTCDPDVVACVGTCEPEQKRCENATTAQHCDPKGEWSTTATCIIGCIDGECASCLPNQIRCTAGIPQSCDPTGQWQNEAPCVELTCIGGVCKGQCAFGAVRCAGKWPENCSASGTWNTLGEPCASGESCYQGQCEAACTAGTKRCAGDYPQICDVNGKWQNNGPACGSCIECNSATGVCETQPEPTTTCKEPLRLDVGYRHTCAVLPNGQLKCWGNNEFGQLGYGDKQHRGDDLGEMGGNLPFVDLDLGVGIAAKMTAMGYNHTCALSSAGGVKCWGTSDFGQLGLGDIVGHGGAPGQMGANLPYVNLGIVVKEISAGAGHTCALSFDAKIKCWGLNELGQLGYDDVNPRGDEANEMGAALASVNLGPGFTATQISAGYTHTCAVSSDGKVKCWGYNAFGQLGYGDTNNRGDISGALGVAALVPVDLGPGFTVTQISAGVTHTCALSSNGIVKCWGSGSSGQLGYGDMVTRGDELGEMGAALDPIDLGIGFSVIQISAGGAHTCALSSNGAVKCWGNNESGQLGLGDEEHRGDNIGEMGSALLPVDLGPGVTATQIRAGAVHTCAHLTGGSVKCWGNNFLGETGLVYPAKYGNEPDEMGDNLRLIDL